eukprot:4331808-Pleurochrysis_carterae.AAC.1
MCIRDSPPPPTYPPEYPPVYPPPANPPGPAPYAGLSAFAMSLATHCDGTTCCSTLAMVSSTSSSSSPATPAVAVAVATAIRIRLGCFNHVQLLRRRCAGDVPLDPKLKAELQRASVSSAPADDDEPRLHRILLTLAVFAMPARNACIALLPLSDALKRADSLAAKRADAGDLFAPCALLPSVPTAVNTVLFPRQLELCEAPVLDERERGEPDPPCVQ